MDVSTIVFAALAIFIVWKLRSVLGTRTGEERPPFNPFVRRGTSQQPDGSPTPSNENGKVVSLPTGNRRPRTDAADPDRWKGFADAGSPLAAGLDRIAAADPSFQVRGFVDGAKAAYELILSAFAKGDRSALAGLLSKDVLEGFVAAIAERESRGETMTHTMVSLDRAAITHADLVGPAAHITVRFESNQINAVRDRDGAAQGGETVMPVIDEWTFEHAVASRDPNWTLVSTHAE